MMEYEYEKYGIFVFIVKISFAFKVFFRHKFMISINAVVILFNYHRMVVSFDQVKEKIFVA